MRSGRKPKLTASVQTMIVQAVAVGVPLLTAGGFAGVSKAALLEWLQRGQGTHPTRPATQAYVDFVDAIEKARAQDETRRVARLEQAAKGGQVVYEKTVEYPDGRIVREMRRTEPQWTADAWFLERSYPDRWGRRERVDMRVQIEAAAARVAGEFGLSPDEVLREAVQLLQEIEHAPEPL